MNMQIFSVEFNPFLAKMGWCQSNSKPDKDRNPRAVESQPILQRQQFIDWFIGHSDRFAGLYSCGSDREKPKCPVGAAWTRNGERRN